MRKLISILAAGVLLAFGSAASAHNCPNEMKAIDAKLAQTNAVEGKRRQGCRASQAG